MILRTEFQRDLKKLRDDVLQLDSMVASAINPHVAIISGYTLRQSLAAFLAGILSRRAPWPGAATR
jgi:hypothetical protein